MATIVTRAAKGSPLTNAEVDANFTNLNTDKVERSASNVAWDTLVGNVAAFNTATTDGPGVPSTSTAYIGVNLPHNSLNNYSVQFVGRNDRYFLRSQENGTFTAWREVYHPGSLNTSAVTTALGYTPVNKAGDTMTGALTAPSFTASTATTGFELRDSGTTIGKAYYNNSTFKIEAIGADVPLALAVNGVVRLTVGTAGTISIPGSVNATGGFTGALTGNASTATTLQTSRNINGVAFNGAADITVTANTPNNVTFNNAGSGGASGSTFNGGSALTVSYNTVGAPSTTGTNASGTWAISITGNAATVTNGVVTTGSYADPSWITSLAETKVLPSQATHAGKFLTTNGTSTSWANVPAPNNGTLTLAVSGTGLSGSATFTADQAGNSTFTVTSNATNANTASTIVARDASGDFSAGTITAALNGNAATVTNGVYTTGTQSIAGNKTFTDTTLFQDAQHYLALTSGNVIYNLDTNDYWNYARSTDTLTFVIGNTTRLTLTSAGNLTASGTVTSNSDARLKTDVLTIPDALAKIEALRGTSFVMNGKRQVGVIAQEIQRVVPEVVQENEDGYLSVAYGNIAAVLIEAVKELSAEVKQLKARLGEQ